MNLSKIIIISVGILFILFAFYRVFDIVQRYGQTSSFEIRNDPGQLGVFDPSLTTDGRTAYLAYSSLSTLENNPVPFIGVNIARSLDGGDDWIYTEQVFESKPGIMTQRIDGQLVEVEGVWRYEMPSIVYTPNDKGRELKIYAYRYFWNGNINLARQTGFIVHKYASAETRNWSEEQWLFSSNPYNPPPPLNKLVQMHLNVLSPELSDVIAYSDPAAFYMDGVIYMTLSAFTQIDEPDREILIASGDAGQSWHYMGAFLSQMDMAGIEERSRFSNAQIVRHDDRLFLLVNFGDDVFNGRGVSALPIEDINRAMLMRSDDGALNISNEVLLNVENLSAFGGGSADYRQDLSTGLIMSRATTQRNGAYQIGIYGHEIFE